VFRRPASHSACRTSTGGFLTDDSEFTPVSEDTYRQLVEKNPDTWKRLSDFALNKRLGFLSKRLFADEDARIQLLSDTLSKAFLKIETFKSGRPILPWLGSIAMNLAMDKKRETARRTELQWADDSIPPDLHHNSVESEFDCDELKTKLRDFIAKDTTYGSVGELLLEHYSNQEIAEMLGINVGTVAVYASRARKKLRSFYAQVEPDYRHHQMPRAGRTATPPRGRPPSDRSVH
jgi:DNA-directed RNA polymerase specialized sigma24 family protein